MVRTTPGLEPMSGGVVSGSVRSRPTAPPRKTGEMDSSGRDEFRRTPLFRSNRWISTWLRLKEKIDFNATLLRKKKDFNLQKNIKSVPQGIKTTKKLTLLLKSANKTPHHTVAEVKRAYLNPHHFFSRLSLIILITKSAMVWWTPHHTVAEGKRAY